MADAGYHVNNSNKCKKCEKNVINGVKCKKCGIHYHLNCVELSGVKVLDESLVNCCLNNVNRDDAAFFSALEELYDLNNKAAINIFRYSIKQKDILISELQEKNDVMNKHVELLNKLVTLEIDTKHIEQKYAESVCTVADKKDDDSNLPTEDHSSQRTQTVIRREISSSSESGNNKITKSDLSAALTRVCQKKLNEYINIAKDTSCASYSITSGERNQDTNTIRKSPLFIQESKEIDIRDVPSSVQLRVCMMGLKTILEQLQDILQFPFANVNPRSMTPKYPSVYSSSKSTPVLSEGEKFGNMNSWEKQDETKLKDLKIDSSLNRQTSAENSSLSSFTSDLDSTPSPMEETPKIRSIIECFESRSQQGNVPENIYGRIDTTNNRIENLKDSLQRTLNRSFSNDSAIRDSDSEKNDNENKVADIITKFQTYIKSMPKYCKPKIHKDTLFYCCLIIEKVREVAQIKFKYPACVEIPHSIENLCFPEGESIPLDCNNTAQSYSLLITNDKGERMFGYCRRVLPEGSTHCLPLAYCILSKYRAPRFYKKILVELESRHGIKNKFRDELISQFYNQKFPKPGDSIKINLTNIEPKINKTENKEDFEDSVELISYVHINKCGEYGSINKVTKKTKEKVDQIYVNEHDIKNSCVTPSYIVENEDMTELILTLHPDRRYEDSDLKRLHELPADILLKIFSSLLLERKVILISSVIGKLSSCVDSLESILYPFTWHHTFIPILPEALWEFVESPTPLICGVLSAEVIVHHKIENGIVVDLDTRTVLVEEGDENKILSGSMQKVWKRSIVLANKAAASMDYVHSVYLSDAYLQVFITCFKDYKKYIVDGSFQKEEFIKNGKTKGIRRFLKMFTETYMFLAFLDSVLQNPENLLAFDKKIEMYGSEGSNVILDKLLEWNR